MAGLDAKVITIIKDTVKSQSIKKESMYFDSSLLECDLTSMDIKPQNLQNLQNSPHPNSASFKRNRQEDALDLRSPTYGTKRQDSRTDMRSRSSQSKGLYV